MVKQETRLEPAGTGTEQRNMTVNQNRDAGTPCRVSVLCATYNHEDYLRQTLESFIS